MDQTNAYFKAIEKRIFLRGYKKLGKRWNKCIELKGYFVEK